MIKVPQIAIVSIALLSITATAGFVLYRAGDASRVVAASTPSAQSTPQPALTVAAQTSSATTASVVAPQAPAKLPKSSSVSAPASPSQPSQSSTSAILSSGIDGYIYDDTGGEACGYPAGFCKMPTQATVDIYDAQGVKVATVSSDSSGQFSVDLAPGTYTLVPATKDGINPSADSHTVTVPNNDRAQAVIVYDPIAVTGGVNL